MGADNRNVYYFDSPNEEWLALRKKYLTATESASLFQLGNKSIMAVAKEKIEPVSIQKNEFMLIGNILEPAVLNSFKLRLNMDVKPAHESKIVMVTDEFSRLSATPDGKYIDDSNRWHLIECKTTGSADPIKAVVNFNKWYEGVPKHYAIQVHTQMAVTGIKSAYIGCILYQYPLPLIVYKIDFHETVHNLLLGEAQRFWDCFDNNKIFHINAAYKHKMLKCLDESASLVFVSHNMKGEV